ncbi:hypothetical protein BGX38DRAFT_1170989 [Terfezia claveryi]|nr:hypothetical protein BGX38DRAFT_1170989 [Terfezia claveryi]
MDRRSPNSVAPSLSIIPILLEFSQLLPIAVAISSTDPSTFKGQVAMETFLSRLSPSYQSLSRVSLIRILHSNEITQS